MRRVMSRPTGRAGGIGGRIRTVAAIATATFVGLAAGGTASAAPGEVVPRISDAAFNRAIAQADLSRGSRDMVRMLFTDYEMSLEDLAVDVDDALGEAGRDRLDAMIDGRIDLVPSEAAEIRVDMAMARVAGWSPAADLLEELLMTPGALLGGDELARFQALVPGLRRRAYLAAIASEGDRRLEAGASVDLIALVDLARTKELSAVPPERLAPVIAGWAAAVDLVIADAARDAWIGRIEARAVAGVGASRDAAERMEAVDDRIISAWERLHAPLEMAAGRIASLAQQAGGEEAAIAWRTRIQRACHPWLAERPARPPFVLSWIERNVNDAETVATARSILASWQGDGADCDARTIDVVVGARRDFRRVIHPRTRSSLIADSDLREIKNRLLQLSGERQAIDREATTALEALVPAGDRTRMRRAVDADVARAGLPARR